jgi:small-conductance mechanosensitive channel
MGVSSFAYRLFFLLHILSAIIGFGGVILNGLYAQRARKRPPAEALAVVEDNAWVSMKVAEIFIYLTALFGLGLVGLSDKVWKFSQTWVWLAIVVYVVAIGISHGLLMPRVKRLIALMREIATGPAPVGGPPPQAGELAKIGPQIGGISMVLNLSLVVILVLMIWKPGL